MRIQLALASLLLLLQTSRLGAARMDSPHPTPTNGDYVILLHGLGRSATSMKRLEWSLTRQGYRVINVSYPSTRQSIADSATISLGRILKDRVHEPDARIHFVTHSLGGIVLRQYLAQNQIPNLGRTVMLAPPNQGSELADKLKRNWLYRSFTGPTGQELGTDAAARPLQLGPANFELGIIAGNRSLNPFFSAAIPGPDDGKVEVARTWLDGASDFLVVPHSHTWLAWRCDVIAAVTHFLRAGSF
jgi:triacylglycerol lipase